MEGINTYNANNGLGESTSVTADAQADHLGVRMLCGGHDWLSNAVKGGENGEGRWKMRGEERGGRKEKDGREGMEDKEASFYMREGPSVGLRHDSKHHNPAPGVVLLTEESMSVQTGPSHEVVGSDENEVSKVVAISPDWNERSQRARRHTTFEF